MNVKQQLDKILLTLALGTASLAPAKSQTYQSSELNYFKNATSAFVNDAQNDPKMEYFSRIAKNSFGLNGKTLNSNYDANYDFYEFYSDNGYVTFNSDNAIGIVVINNTLSYRFCNNVFEPRPVVQELQDQEWIEMLQQMAKLKAAPNSPLIKALAAAEQNSDNKTINISSARTAKNRAGTVDYRITPEGRVIFLGINEISNLTIPVPSVFMDQDGTYYVGKGQGRSSRPETTRKLANIHLNSPTTRQEYCVYLDLVENRSNETLTWGEQLFIQQFKNFLNEYGLGLDANNKIIVLTGQQTTNTFYYNNYHR